MQCSACRPHTVARVRSPPMLEMVGRVKGLDCHAERLQAGWCYTRYSKQVKGSRLLDLKRRTDITRGPKQVTHKRFHVIQKLKKYMAISCLPVHVEAKIGFLQKVIYMFSRNNLAQWSFS